MQILRHKTERYRDNGLFSAEYNLAVEELLEIYIDGSPYAVTMRLPGDDINLVAGFCFTEGIIRSRDDLLSISHCDAGSGRSRILVSIDAKGGKSTENCGVRTEHLVKSSRGLCGRSKARDVYKGLSPVETSHSISLSNILTLKEHFEARQSIFHLTGSTHSASIFGFQEKHLAFSEDVGRHNALDKAIGALLLEGKTDEAFLGIVSSRLSFEMVQKAGVLGIEMLAGLSAATSMAVEMADRLNITLIGFLRENSMSIYTHPERILHS
ncbi:MAG: formate dehydrogenase accessory sulfurtransferase FdhD [Syntrophobacteraceae bacterium]